MSTLQVEATPAILTTFNDDQQTPTPTDMAQGPTGALVSMISALDATMAATDPEYTRPPLALGDNPEATANALSVLFDALPSAVAIEMASKYNLRPSTTALQPTITEPQPSITESQPSITKSQPTPQILLVPSSIPEPFSSPASITTVPSSTTLSQTSTTAPPSATRSLQPVFTTRPPASEDMHKRAIAGIVSGVLAAVVLILLLIIFLLRRRSQGKRPFEHRKVYPEVAWLYDPAPTPTGSVHNRHGSGEETLLQPHQDEMEQVRQGSPERSAAKVTSPLLVPPPRILNGDDSGTLSAVWKGGTTIRTVRRSSASATAGERRSVPAVT